jgi:hypothetical protein
MDATSEDRRAMTSFAAIGAGILGAWHVISGIAGVRSETGVETVNEALFGIDLTTFGWIWIAVGAVQLVVAVAIFRRNPVGLVAGVVWAGFSGALTAFVIIAAPVWALTVIALDVVVIRALVRDPEFGNF